MLLNLEYAMKSDAYVCTLMSNWCRLVDELRATVGKYVRTDTILFICTVSPVFDIHTLFYHTVVSIFLSISV